MTIFVLIAFAALTGSIPASQIAPGIYLVPGLFVPGTQPDGNTVIFRASSPRRSAGSPDP